MAILTHDSGALRSTLILAGLHYSWNVCALSASESAVLFHKVECIRSINKLINDPADKGFHKLHQVVCHAHHVRGQPDSPNPNATLAYFPCLVLRRQGCPTDNLRGTRISVVRHRDYVGVVSEQRA